MRTYPRARLIVAACLFVGWLAFLAYLAFSTRQPVVLSRPQFLAAQAVLLVDIQEEQGRPRPKVTLNKILWAAQDFPELQAKELVVSDLNFHGKDQGYQGPGTYVAPVSRRVGGEAAWEITPLPSSSPGYVAKFNTLELEAVGKDQEKLAHLIATTFPQRAAQAKDLIAQTEKIAQVVARNVDDATAQSFKHQVEALGGKVKVRFAESRLYPATAETLRQFEQIHAKK